MESTVFVLQDSVSLGQLEQLASANQWLLIEDRPRARLDEPCQRAYRTSAQTEVRYVEDHLINVKALFVSGDDAAADCALVRANLAHHTREQLVAQCAQADGAPLIGLMYKLARLGTDETDQPTLDLYARASLHPELAIRRASITAMAYTPWQACVPLLEDLARRDTRLRPKTIQLLEAIAPSRQQASDGAGSKAKSKSKTQKRH